MNIEKLKRWIELLKRSGSNTKKQVREEMEQVLKRTEEDIITEFKKLGYEVNENTGLIRMTNNNKTIHFYRSHFHIFCYWNNTRTAAPLSYQDVALFNEWIELLIDEREDIENAWIK